MQINYVLQVWKVSFFFFKWRVSETARENIDLWYEYTNMYKYGPSTYRIV